MLPNFLVIGAMKAGTTALHNYLTQHPDIFMTYVKEADFFLNHSPGLAKSPFFGSRDKLIHLMLRGYSDEPLLGESSTTYTEAPTLGAEARRTSFDNVRT